MQALVREYETSRHRKFFHTQKLESEMKRCHLKHDSKRVSPQETLLQLTVNISRNVFSLFHHLQTPSNKEQRNKNTPTDL